MQRLCIFLLLIGLTSCEYFNVKKTSSEAILNEELKTFNWSEVDEYPSFSSCDSSSTKPERKQCFENTLATFILNNLQNEDIVVNQDINDTLLVEFQISEIGELTLLELSVDSLTTSEIPNIKEFLTRSLDSLPQIFPAIKRGQQVKTQFKLPIVIAVN